MSPDFIAFVQKNWYLFLAVAVIVGLLFADTIRRRAAGVRAVSAMQLPQLTRDDAIIVDVCEPGEYKKGHIPQAVNLPLKKLLSDHSTLEKHKTSNVILACRMGNRSESAARHLAKHGFEHVYTLAGGMTSWEKENLPLERG